MRVEYRIEPCKSALTAGAGDAVPLVAQPVHGLRAPMHVLLRPALRAARRSAVGRPLRPLDPRQVERRRDAPPRARAPLVAARGGRHRHRDRSVPARRGPLPTHARVHPRARRRRTRRSRSSRAARSSSATSTSSPTRPGEVQVSVYVSLPTLDERVWRTTEPGTAPPASRLRAIRTLAEAGIDVGVGMAPILPGLSDGAEQLRGGRPRCTRGRRADDLGERRPSSARRARALPRSARARLAGAGRALRGAVRHPCIPTGRRCEGDRRTRPHGAGIGTPDAPTAGSARAKAVGTDRLGGATALAHAGSSRATESIRTSSILRRSAGSRESAP